MTCELVHKRVCEAAKDRTRLWVMLRAGRYLTPASVPLTLVQASQRGNMVAICRSCWIEFGEPMDECQFPFRGSNRSLIWTSDHARSLAEQPYLQMPSICKSTAFDVKGFSCVLESKILTKLWPIGTFSDDCWALAGDKKSGWAFFAQVWFQQILKKWLN